MYSLGITGGICCGKTEFTRLVQTSMEVAHFDADACVRKHLLENKEVAAAIGQVIGKMALDKEGRPDRDSLRTLIHRNSQMRKDLENILHPLVWSEYEKKKSDITATHSLLLADIPLIYETESQNRFDAVVVIGCSPETQIHRLMKKRGIDEELANKMLSSQMPLRQKIILADYLIWNDGSFATLKKQTCLFAENLKKHNG